MLTQGHVLHRGLTRKRTCGRLQKNADDKERVSAAIFTVAITVIDYFYTADVVFGSAAGGAGTAAFFVVAGGGGGASFITDQAARVIGGGTADLYYVADSGSGQAAAWNNLREGLH